MLLLTKHTYRGRFFFAAAYPYTGHTPGRWRLITDLSHPEGGSVKDGIASEWCSLRYMTVEEVAAAAQRLGTGALLAKLDIKYAYRLLPVHPDDRRLLGVECTTSMGRYRLASARPPRYSRQWPTLGDAQEGGRRGRALPRRLHHGGPPGLPGVQGQSRPHSCGVRGAGRAAGAGAVHPSDIEMNTEEGVLRLPEEKLVRLRWIGT